MSSALVRSKDESIAITDFAKGMKDLVGQIEAGERERCVLIRHGSPVAVVVNVESFQEMLQELETLRVAAVGNRRVASLGADRPLTTSDMQQIMF